jgi:lysophospholipase L1-like esterase
LASSLPCFAGEPWELANGDRVVFLGGTFIEREGNYGYLETALTTAWPDRTIVFRNLGWSGDTVWAESRGSFDPPAEGYKRTIALITELKPTVIFLAYGANESFAGEPGLAPFIKQYEKLCDDLKPTNARLVFLTPPPFERPSPALPDVSQHNGNLSKYVAAIRELAQRRSGRLVDLFAQVAAQDEIVANDASRPSRMAYSSDGVTLNPAGYLNLARLLANDLQLPTPRDPNCGLPGLVRDLKTVTHRDSTVSLTPTEQLRLKVVEKNGLFFHRWRPQNITYLTGFRKHEQGNNAVEIAQFDRLIEKAESEIASLLKSQ